MQAMPANSPPPRPRTPPPKNAFLTANVDPGAAMPADNAYAFLATEYVSQGGCGNCMIKLYSDGWHVRVWRGKGQGYVNIGAGPCTSVAEAVEAYRTWNAGVLAGDIEW